MSDQRDVTIGISSDGSRTKIQQNDVYVKNRVPADGIVQKSSQLFSTAIKTWLKNNWIDSDILRSQRRHHFLEVASNPTFFLENILLMGRFL